MSQATSDPPHLIEVKVNEIHQLFNSMDPSPFHERDLDHDAEPGLTIGGWVAMWKPLDICLYRWWPLLNLKQLHDKLSAAEVEVRIAAQS